MRFLALAVALFGFAGCLSASSPDGGLHCSDVPSRACPEGFYCLATTNTCWRYGHFPDMTGEGQFIPSDEDMSVPPEEDLAMSVDDLSSVDDAGLPADLSQSD
jgi:hypothetical protein